MAVLEKGRDISRVTLSGLRRSSIVLRRYFVPQRDALTTLEIEDLAWMGDSDRAWLREAAKRVRRFGDELDAIRDHAQIVHDQMIDQRVERMNRQMLLLSIVATIFLPLRRVTGLLCITVGGGPGSGLGVGLWADNPWAFTIATIDLLATGLGFFLWFRAIGQFK